MRTVYGNHERFETTYFKKFPGYYVTGDGKPWLFPSHTSYQDMYLSLLYSERVDGVDRERGRERERDKFYVSVSNI